MRILAVWTVKGGVGKTTTAVNLGHLAARSGLRTLIWDLDPQGAASYTLRVKARVKGGAKRLVRKRSALDRALRPTDYPNLELLPADFSNRNLDLELDARKRPRRRIAAGLAPLGERFDLALLDCPPSVSLVSESVIEAADALLVPVVPSTLSLRTLEQVRSLAARRRRLPILPFLSMVDRRKREHREICAWAARGGEFLSSLVPASSLAERMGLERAPITATAPSSPVALAYVALWREVAERLGLDPAGGIAP